MKDNGFNTQIDSNIADDYFVAVAKGFFKILTAGDYTFQLKRNYRGSLKIDSTVQLVYVGSTGTVVVTLTEGDHEIESVFSENTGTREWKINYKGPDTNNNYAPLRSDNDKTVLGTHDFCVEVWAGTKKKEVSGLKLNVCSPSTIISANAIVTTQQANVGGSEMRFRVPEYTNSDSNCPVVDTHAIYSTGCSTSSTAITNALTLTVIDGYLWAAVADDAVAGKYEFCLTISASTITKNVDNLVFDICATSTITPPVAMINT